MTEHEAASPARNEAESTADSPAEEAPRASEAAELDAEAVAERFKSAGESVGRDAARRMARDARKLIHELVRGLYRDLESIRNGKVRVSTLTGETVSMGETVSPGEAEAGDAPEGVTEEDRGELAAERPARAMGKVDWAKLQPMFERLRNQLAEATDEWNQLVTAVAEMESEFSGTTLESVLGNDLERLLEPPAPAPATAATRPAPPAEVAQIAPETSETSAETKTETPPEPDGAATAPALEAIPEALHPILASKLDELLLLVKGRLEDDAARDPKQTDETTGGAARPSREWTSAIALEVASRLKDSLPLVSEPSRSEEPKTGERTLPPAPKRISFDDVAAMIDEITGRSGSAD